MKLKPPAGYIAVFHAKNPTFMLPREGLPAPSWPFEYEHVATVATTDVEVAYSLTNHIDHSWTENPEVIAHKAAKVRSSSVGDVFVRSTGSCYIVAPIGFEYLGEIE